MSLALLAPLWAGCETKVSASYNPTDYSGGVCDNTPGVACVWAGVIGYGGFGSLHGGNHGDGQPIEESFLYFVADLTFGPDGTPYVVDWNNHRVRKVTPQGTFETFTGTDQEGDGPIGTTEGAADTDEIPYNTAPGCKPSIVSLNHPTDVRFAPDGTFVLDAWHDNKIRVVDPITGLMKVLAGGTYGYAGDNGPSWGTLFDQEKSIAIDDAGRIYTNDQKNERIRMIDVDANRTITTIAGTGTKGYAGDGGPALAAQFNWDNSGTPDPAGALTLKDHQLYIADSSNNRIRVMDLDTQTISCLAGDGCKFPVTLDYPMDLEWGPDGRLYVAERDGNVVDALDLNTGVLTPIAGNGKACPKYPDTSPCIEAANGPSAKPKNGVAVPALELQLNKPYGIAFDPNGVLYVADTQNSRLLRIVL